MTAIVRISLTNGGEAIIDSKDAPLVEQYRWHRRSDGTIAACAKRDDGKWRTVYLSRLVMSAAPGTIIDHEQHDKSDNRKSKPRVTTQQGNQRNSRRGAQINKTGFKGVQQVSKNCWRASITVSPGDRRTIGYSDSPEDAARLYDAAAREHFGEFANVNFSD